MSTKSVAESTPSRTALASQPPDATSPSGTPSSGVSSYGTPVSQETLWTEFAGKGITVFARAGSYAAGRAHDELRDAERLLLALRALLQPETQTLSTPLAVYLFDPAAPLPSPLPQDAVLSALSADAPGEPPFRAITERLVTRWLGPQAAAMPVFVDGLAGLAAARAKVKADVPSVAEADAWVQTELEAKRPVALRGGGDEWNPAATSFVAFLADSFGQGALRLFLKEYDPARQDKAAQTAFKQPLAVLEDAWLGGLRRRAPGQDALRALLPRLLALLEPYRAQWAEVLALLVVAAAFNIVAPLAARFFTHRISEYFSHPGGQSGAAFFRERMAFPLLVFAALVVLDALVSLRRAYAVNRLNLSVLNGLQGRLFRHLLQLGHNFYNSPQAKMGELMTRVTTDLQAVQQALSQVSNKFLYQLLTLGWGIGALFYANTGRPELTVLVLLVVPLFGISYALLKSQNKAASREQRKRVGESAAALQEDLSAHALIKAFGLQERTLAAYDARSAAQQRSALHLAVLSALSDMSEDMATALAQLIIFGVGGWLVLIHPGTGPDHGIGDLAAALLLVKTIFGPIASLSGIGQTVQQASGSIERVNELFDAPVTVADAPQARPLAPLAQSIQMEAVTFGYGDGPPILNHLTLSIPAGRNVAIVGPSGCGKSTTVNLLLRFYDPQEGRVLFDGQDLRGAALHSLRAEIGFVFQDTFIFNSTVRDNIALGRPQATDAEIAAAAQAARLDAYVDGLPHGFDSVLGERGGNMSGGQRQRLAIARAILRDPRILILDEATSALDAQSEAAIQETLSTLASGRTTISITHRLSWAARADRIYVLDKGTLVEEGTHAELIHAGGLYHKLWQEQTGPATERAAPDPEQLRAIPLFASMSADARARLAGTLTREREPAGAEIVRQGEPGAGFYIVEQGQLDVFVTRESGHEEQLATLSSGDIFGEMALLSETPRTATVRAVTPCELLRLAKEDFDALLAQEPSIKAAVAQTAAARSKAVS